MGVIALCEPETLSVIAVDPVVPGPDLVTSITHGGPFGIVGALLFWIAYKGVPMVQDQYSKITNLFLEMLRTRDEQSQKGKQELMDYETTRNEKLAASLSQLATAHAAQAEAIQRLAQALEHVKPAKRKPEEGGPNAAAH